MYSVSTTRRVPLTEDQYAVSEFGSEGADEPFGETVRPRTSGRNRDDADAEVSKEGVEGCGELTGPISHEELELGEAIAKIHHQVADLLRRLSAVGGWWWRPAGAPIGWRPPARKVRRSAGVSSRSPRGRSRRPASSMSALRRNCRQVGSVCRTGAGGIRRRFKNVADRQGSHAVAQLE
jgi:hypothetical protein